MFNLDALKSVVSLVVGVGTSKIVHTIIRNNVDPENVIDEVTVYAGSAVIGMMAADATKKYTDDKIDAAAAWVKEVKQDMTN